MEGWVSELADARSSVDKVYARAVQVCVTRGDGWCRFKAGDVDNQEEEEKQDSQYECQ